MFLVFKFPVHGVDEMDGRAANLFLEGGINDLNTAVMSFRQPFRFLLGIGVTAKIAPSSGGMGRIECKY
ncbi:MAG TPA: hypothetical protein VE734_02685 [Terriglobales bacterium]|nr:hypothetical protein [Terriglobales bacterium]